MIDCFRDVTWLFRVECAGLTFADRAKAAVTCANIAAQHERRRAIRPALENVRATRFLTNRVQVQSFDQLQDLVLVGRVAQADTQPFRFGLAYLLVVADYSEFAGHLEGLCQTGMKITKAASLADPDRCSHPTRRRPHVSRPLAAY